MTLILIKNKTVLDIPTLLRRVLAFIYDEKSLSLEEIREMQESIVNWKKAIDLEEEKLSHANAMDMIVFGEKKLSGHKYSEEQYMLQDIASLLKKNDDGKLDEQKALFKEHGIDYRKFYRLPEAYVAEDFIRGQKLVEESNKREGIET